MSYNDTNDIFSDSHLERELREGETLFWVGRPNESVTLALGMLTFKKWMPLVFFVCLCCIIGIMVDTAVIRRVGDIFFLICTLGGIIITYFDVHRGYAKHAPWYGITNERILIRRLDDGDYKTYSVDLNNINSVLLKNTLVNIPQSQNTATLICKCQFTVISFMSKRIKLESIENPMHVMNIITKAKKEKSQNPNTSEDM